jgi:hypothetical protein
MVVIFQEGLPPSILQDVATSKFPLRQAKRFGTPVASKIIGGYVPPYLDFMGCRVR